MKKKKTKSTNSSAKSTGILEELEEKLEEGYEYLVEPKHIRILKIFVIAIAIGIIGYIIYSNFIISKDFIYFYDIGSNADIERPFLTPDFRITEAILEEEINYRNLTSQLVYFDVPIPRGAKTLYVEARIFDNFPKGAKISFGARDRDEWHYLYQNFYNQTNRNNWVVSGTQFDLKDTFPKNGKLSILFNTPHLNDNKNETNTQHIPVDWIKIKIHKPGLLEKWGL
jgi:hypothetical protein